MHLYIYIYIYIIKRFTNGDSEITAEINRERELERDSARIKKPER